MFVCAGFVSTIIGVTSQARGTVRGQVVQEASAGSCPATDEDEHRLGAVLERCRKDGLKRERCLLFLYYKEVGNATRQDRQKSQTPDGVPPQFSPDSKARQQEVHQKYRFRSKVSLEARGYLPIGAKISKCMIEEEGWRQRWTAVVASHHRLVILPRGAGGFVFAGHRYLISANKKAGGSFQG